MLSLPLGHSQKAQIDDREVIACLDQGPDSVECFFLVVFVIFPKIPPLVIILFRLYTVSAALFCVYPVSGPVLLLW